MSDKDTIKDAMEAFKEADEAWSEVKTSALEDVRFARLGEQWPDDVLRRRVKEGRPALVINRLPTFIRQVVNDARQSRPAIKVSPVDDTTDPETAEVLAGIIRHIEYASDAQTAYDTALESAVSGGFGFFRVSVERLYDDAWDVELAIRRIANPQAVYWDPTTMAADSSDWRYAFVVEDMSRASFKAKYPGARESDWDGGAVESWLTEDTVRVAEHWVREEVDRVLLRMSDGTVLDERQYLANKDLFDVSGIAVQGSRKTVGYKVTQRLMTAAEVLEETEWRGRYIPIIPVYGDEIVVEGKRYFRSLINSAKDAQRQLNFWRSAATELVALAPRAPWVGPRGAFLSDADKWETANTESHPFLEYDGPTPPVRVPFDGPPAGALQEALNASDDLKSIIGIYDASLGARSNETSGRAIMARQREGDVSTFHFIDNLGRAIRHCGRVLVDLIPSVYSTPRVMRVLGVDGETQQVQVNTPYEQGGAMRMHDLTTGRYDVTVDIGPSYTTKRQEAAEQMTQMVQAYPDIAPLIGDIIAKNLDWPEADEIAKRLKAMLPPQIQSLQEAGDDMPPEAQMALQAAQQQMQQMQQLIAQGQQALQDLQAKLQAAESDRSAKMGELALKDKDIQARYQAEMTRAQADIEIARIEAEAKADIARVEAAVTMIGDRLTAMSQQLAERPEPEERETEDRPKTITIQAPSGATYRGTIQ